MKGIIRQILIVTVLTTTVFTAHAQDSAEVHNHSRNAAAHDIVFIENLGQWDPTVLYKANIPGGFFFIDKNIGLTYYFYNSKQLDEYQHHLKFLHEGKLDYHVVKVDFPGAAPGKSVAGEEKILTRFNYFKGRNTEKWVSNARGYHKLVIKQLYPGVDLELMSYGGVIKYNFVVSPFTDPGVINIRYKGANELYMEDNSLVIKTSVNTFSEILPEVYTLSNGTKSYKKCRFRLTGNTLDFDFPQDKVFPDELIIDPVIIFSTYSGSWADNFGYTATYDDSGYAYSGGTVFFDSFPATAGAFQKHWRGGLPSNNPGSGGARDIGILKYSPDGTQLIYATYLGGSGNEDPHSMVVNSNYELIVFGNTNSTDFPIGNTFYDSSYNGNFDIYLAKLSSNGSQLLSSTFIGGSNEDGINGYFVSPSYTNKSSLGHNYGDVYRGEVNVGQGDTVFVVTTTKSTNFPHTNGVFQSIYGGGLQDACVIKMNPQLSVLEAATFIGGNNDDAGYGIAFHSDGSIFICGGTKSTDLPVPTGKYLETFQGGNADGFLFHLNATLTKQYSSTYIGTRKYDQTYFVQTDDSNFVYVIGQTKSDSFPVVNAKYSNYSGSQFIMKLNRGLDSILYSTVFGSGRTDPDLSPSAFLVDHCERVYFSGWGGSTNHTNNPAAGIYDSWNWGSTNGLPLKNAPYPNTDGSDYYIAVFAKNMEGLLYATYFGDPNSADHVDGGTSRFDKNSIIYQSVCAGCNTTLSTFPTTSNAWSTVKKGHRPPNSSGYYSPTGCNNAVFKIDLDIPDLFADFDVDTLFCLLDSARVINKSIGGKYYHWDFGDGDTASGFEPRHVYSDTGVYTITLYATNLLSCDQYDTFSKPIHVLDVSESDFSAVPQKCKNDIHFTAITPYASSFYWDFGDTNSLANISRNRNPVHVYSDTGVFRVTFITDSGTVCENRKVKTIRVNDLPKAGFTYIIDTCSGKTVFKDSSLHASTWKWYFGDKDSGNTQNPVHFYRKADSFFITQITEPNSVCADTAYKTLVIKTPKADILSAIDTCRLKGSFINPAPFVKKMSIWILDSKDTLWFRDTIHLTFLPGQHNLQLVANLTTLCLDTIDVNITIPPLPQADFEIQHSLCDSSALFVDKSFNNSRLFWNFGNGDTSSLPIPGRQYYNRKGSYTIFQVATSASGCTDTLFDTLQVNPLAIADFQYKNTICETTVRFTNLSTKPATYLWEFGNGMTDTTYNPGPYDFDSAGLYLVRLIVTDGPCIDSMEKQIALFAPPEIDFDFFPDSCSSAIEFVSNASGVINKQYFWEFGDSVEGYSKNDFHVYKKPGKYYVTFTINKDTVCTSTKSKEVEALAYNPDDIVVPNFFTPNADNTNDKFTIRGLNFSCDSYKLYIYNRWGQPVFESKGNHLDWDGRYKNVLVSEGTYYYVLKGNDFSTAGTITVMYTSTR